MRTCVNQVARNNAPGKQSGTEKNRPVLGAPEYTLDPDDIQFLRKLAQQDEFIRQLAASSAAVEVLGKAIEFASQGPAKLAAQWNLAVIKGWRSANKALDFLGKHAVRDASVCRSDYLG